MGKEVLRPKARLLLSQLTASYPDGRFQESHKDLANRVGVSPSSALNYLNQLCDLGLITKQSSNELFTERSKPRYNYQILEKGIKFINQYSFDDSPHKELIGIVKCPKFKRRLIDEYKECSNESTKLQYSPKTEDCIFLLEVLLGHADEFGVVFGVGRAKLCSMVGCKIGKLTQLVDILFSQGFISKITPGMSGFFGIQPSIYFLNLAHRFYYESKAGQIATLHLEQDIAAPDPIRQLTTFLNSAVTLKSFDNHFEKELKRARYLKENISVQKYQANFFLRDLINISALRLIQSFDTLLETNENEDKLLPDNKVLEKQLHEVLKAIIKPKDASAFKEYEVAKYLLIFVLNQIEKI